MHKNEIKRLDRDIDEDVDKCAISYPLNVKIV